MTILERPTAPSSAATDEVVIRSLAERLPLIGLAVLACLSVGYGFGTLVQFDHDWRDAPPVLVASLEGSVAPGRGAGSVDRGAPRGLDHSGHRRPVP